MGNTGGFNARDAAQYEQVMGRWSRRMAPLLVDFAQIDAAREVLDLGCGTGSLLFELARTPGRTRVAGLDPAAIYVDAVRARITDPRIDVTLGDARALPFADASFDAVLSQLVLQFIPETDQALREAKRVTRPGGTIAATVWNSYGGMPHQRMFWDIACLLDPNAAAVRNHTYFRPMTRKGDLALAMQAVGLQDVVESSITIWMDFSCFQDMWAPIEAGEGTLGKYVTALDDAARQRLRTALHASYCSGQPDGERNFACTAHVAKAIAP